jgi:hypothetical protein
MLMDIREVAKYLQDSDFFDKIDIQTRNKIHSLRLEEIIGKAKKFEYKDQYPKAIDQYLEAVYYLKTEAVDKEFAQIKINTLEKKIESLRERISAKRITSSNLK